jgi:hypothetical protein
VGNAGKGQDRTAILNRPVAAIAISNDASESEERGNLTAFLWLGLLRRWRARARRGYFFAILANGF